MEDEKDNATMITITKTTRLRPYLLLSTFPDAAILPTDDGVDATEDKAFALILFRTASKPRNLLRRLRMDDIDSRDAVAITTAAIAIVSEGEGIVEIVYLSVPLILLRLLVEQAPTQMASLTIPLSSLRLAMA